MPQFPKWISPLAIVVSSAIGGGTVVVKGAPLWVGGVVVGVGFLVSIPTALVVEYKWLANHHETRADAEAKMRHAWISHAGSLMIALGVTNWILSNLRTHLKTKPDVLAQIDDRIRKNEQLIELVEKFKTRPE